MKTNEQKVTIGYPIVFEPEDRIYFAGKQLYVSQLTHYPGLVIGRVVVIMNDRIKTILPFVDIAMETTLQISSTDFVCRLPQHEGIQAALYGNAYASNPCCVSQSMVGDVHAVCFHDTMIPKEQSKNTLCYNLDALLKKKPQSPFGALRIEPRREYDMENELRSVFACISSFYRDPEIKLFWKHYLLSVERKGQIAIPYG